MVGINDSMWRGRHVFVTGHTGFKGGWLSLWLGKLGALVHGYALDPEGEPALYSVARIPSVLRADTRADLADLAALERALTDASPEVVFHLAAQPLVRQSYQDPLGTFATNVMGTANLLEAVRKVDSVRAVVLITTDKVYDNREWQYPYREIDSLGGRDPYSASKAASELVAASYRASFFGSGSPRPVHVATARAGNVIGGGDWAADRLVPDCLRAFVAGNPVCLRFPAAVRPWQHVLEPLAGYLTLAEHLLGEGGASFAQAWNFGPDPAGDATVGEVAAALAGLWGGKARAENSPDAGAPHEAGLLRLDSGRARGALGWTPRWSLAQALGQTVEWERARQSGADMLKVSLDQIAAYVEDDD